MTKVISITILLLVKIMRNCRIFTFIFTYWYTYTSVHLQVATAWLSEPTCSELEQKSNRLWLYSGGWWARIEPVFKSKLCNKIPLTTILPCDPLQWVSVYLTPFILGYGLSGDVSCEQFDQTVFLIWWRPKMVKVKDLRKVRKKNPVTPLTFKNTFKKRNHG